MPKTLRGSFEQALRPPPSVVKGVQACRLPGLKCLKRSAAASTRHSGHCPLLLGAVSVSVCLPVSVRLSACLSVCLPVFLSACLPVCLSVCPSVSVSVNVGQCRSMPPVCLPACSSLPFARPQMPKTLRGSFEQALRPLPSVVKGVQACRLPGLKCLKRCAAASSRHSSHCPLACRLPGLKCLKRCAAASSRHSGHCPLLLRAFKPTVCQASNA